MFAAKKDILELVKRRETICASLFLPLRGDSPHENVVRANNVLREAALRAGRFSTTPKAETWLALTSQALHEFAEQPSVFKGVAAFAAAELHRALPVPMTVPEMVVVAHRFYIRPLLPLFEPARFYILALSQHQARLLAADRFTVEELPPVPLPQYVREELHEESFAKELAFHSTGSGAGKRNIIYHGGREELKDRISTYLLRLNTTLFEHRVPDQCPIVLAAVDYIASLYRQVNSSPNLLDRSVSGNPDLVSAKELHAKAWPLVEPVLNQRRKTVLGSYIQLQSSELASDGLDTILGAAKGGRVRTLFTASDRQRFDAHGDDLLNEAVCDVLLNRGEVYELPAAEMPEQKDIAALMRY